MFCNIFRSPSTRKGKTESSKTIDTGIATSAMRNEEKGIGGIKID
jgi:hypothetical protein